MARARVTIDSGELPSARGVAEGYALSQVIGRWQQIAHGSFREDCRFLKQMIEETDELQLWQKNVGGFTFKDRDDFLRNKVLIDYELTERDMVEIVAALKHDDVDKVRNRLAEKAKATMEAAPSEVGPGQGHRSDLEHRDDSTKLTRGSTSAAYLAARIKRDRPDIVAGVERGEYKSIRAAAIAAGIVKPPSPLDTLRKAWRKASDAERAAFLAEIGEDV
jgi:hypothetical protein